jgi:hypothetical protein
MHYSFFRFDLKRAMSLQLKLGTQNPKFVSWKKSRRTGCRPEIGLMRETYLSQYLTMLKLQQRQSGIFRWIDCLNEACLQTFRGMLSYRVAIFRLINTRHDVFEKCLLRRTHKTKRNLKQYPLPRSKLRVCLSQHKNARIRWKSIKLIAIRHFSL